MPKPLKEAFDAALSIAPVGTRMDAAVDRARQLDQMVTRSELRGHKDESEKERDDRRIRLRRTATSASDPALRELARQELAKLSKKDEIGDTIQPKGSASRMDAAKPESREDIEAQIERVRAKIKQHAKAEDARARAELEDDLKFLQSKLGDKQEEEKGEAKKDSSTRAEDVADAKRRASGMRQHASRRNDKNTKAAFEKAADLFDAAARLYSQNREDAGEAKYQEAERAESAAERVERSAESRKDEYSELAKGPIADLTEARAAALDLISSGKLARTDGAKLDAAMISVKHLVKDSDNAKHDAKEKALWKYNKRSGYWDHQRSVTDDTAQKWLSTFQGDEPNETFKISANRPSGKP